MGGINKCATFWLFRFQSNYLYLAISATVFYYASLNTYNIVIISFGRDNICILFMFLVKSASFIQFLMGQPRQCLWGVLLTPFHIKVNAMRGAKATKVSDQRN